VVSQKTQSGVKKRNYDLTCISIMLVLTISVLAYYYKDKSKMISYVGENAEFERQMLSENLMWN
jgi:acyl CoA:acetate/3-ketoacid CoA transferase alpha subunit